MSIATVELLVSVGGEIQPRNVEVRYELHRAFPAGDPPEPGGAELISVTLPGGPGRPARDLMSLMTESQLDRLTQKVTELP